MKHLLEIITNDLNKYRDMNRDELLKKCIEHKLLITLDNYSHLIDVNSAYLLSRNSCKVLKAITKLQKQEDKNILEQNQKEGDFNE